MYNLFKINKYSLLMLLPTIFALINFTYLEFSMTKPYGILGQNWSLLKFKTDILIITCIISLIPFFLVKFNSDEDQKNFRPVNIIFYISALGSLIFLLISYPWIFGIGGWRTSRLLPGDGWNGFYIVFYLLAVIYSNARSFLQKSILIIIPIVSILGGERVDSLFLIPVAYISGKLGRIKFSTGLFAGLMLFVFASFIQYYRANERVGAGEIISSVLMNRTLADVADVSLSVIRVKDDFNVDLGSKIINNYINSLVPFSKYGGAGSPDNIGNVTDRFYSNVNGGMFSSELYAIGGYWAVFLGFYLYASTAAFFINKRDHNLVTKLIALYIVSSSIRVSWYGLVYIIKPIYIILLLSLILNLIIRLSTSNKISHNNRPSWMPRRTD